MQMEKTRDRMLRAMFVALIAAGAFIRIPVPVVPFTLQYLFTMLAGLLLGGRKGCEAVRLCARRVQPAVSDVPLRHGALRDREGGSGPGAGCDEGVVSAVGPVCPPSARLQGILAPLIFAADYFAHIFGGFPASILQPHFNDFR